MGDRATDQSIWSRGLAKFVGDRDPFHAQLPLTVFGLFPLLELDVFGNGRHPQISSVLIFGATRMVHIVGFLLSFLFFSSGGAYLCFPPCALFRSGIRQ